LLRFLTAGSVDDGKSTLIGRLLYDSDGIYDDQLSSVRKASVAKNLELDLSLLTDGLRAEREQGITIDVAYRYFSTPRRKFIIADAPGHEQYTRNMATGASTAELAVVLVDARKGVLRQTRRHTLIASLMGIRQMIIAVNKMDLVGFDQQAFLGICGQFHEFAKSMEGVAFHFVPLSALDGDNVIWPSPRMAWYEGSPLLHLLETLPASAPDEGAFRFPIQAVIRPNQDFRGYAGRVASGVARPGQDVIALPSRQRTAIQDILLHDRGLDDAGRGRSVVLTTTDHIDLGRGDMLVSAGDLPEISTKITARIVWLSHQPLRQGQRYLVKHTTRLVCGTIGRLEHKVDINTFAELEADSLQLNEIGLVQLDLHNPIFCDPYRMNRSTGSFIIIDPACNDTVAAGMVVAAVADHSGEFTDDYPGSVSDRKRGMTVWFTGLSGAGKTTICRSVATELLALGLQVEVLDGDVIRHHLCKDLGYSKADRDENIRRIAFVSQLLTRNGTIVLVSAISPYRASREAARRSIGEFLEVYVDTPLAVCELRDPKLLYRQARAGRISGFTGIDDPYEPPLEPEIVCNTAEESTRESASKVVAAVVQRLSPRLP
jgi:bifunctional enzyme CysN/CysC